MHQEASKTPSDASKTPQDASKRPPRPSKIDFSSQHGLLKLQKTIKIYWKNNDSEPLHEFNIRSLLYQTLMPTWLHFGVKFPPRHSKIDFSSQHGPPEPQKTIKIYWKNNSSEPLH